MEYILADHIRAIIAKLVKKYCFGCQHGCLSQKDHDCLTVSYEMQVLIHLEEAIDQIQTEIYSEQFQKKLVSILCKE